MQTIDAVLLESVGQELQFRDERRDRLCAPAPSTVEGIGGMTILYALLMARMGKDNLSPTLIRETLVDIIATCVEIERGLD